MNWHTFYETINSTQITVQSTVVKLFLSLLAGGIIGLNREQHKQPAGFRTHILICLGSTLLMVLSIYIPQTYLDFKNGDPGRIAAQVVAGIGFLGAGAIIKLGRNIKGLTTAASIWLIAAVGLTIGAGLFVISLVTIVLALFTLVLLEHVERRLVSKLYVKTIILKFNSKRFPETPLKSILKEMNIKLCEYHVTVFNIEKEQSEFKMIVNIPEKTNISKLIELLSQLEALKSIKIH
jgi:putative Mg2+ transporter-C (MgtC) family protein